MRTRCDRDCAAVCHSQTVAKLGRRHSVVSGDSTSIRRAHRLVLRGYSSADGEVWRLSVPLEEAPAFQVLQAGVRESSSTLPPLKLMRSHSSECRQASEDLRSRPVARRAGRAVPNRRRSASHHVGLRPRGDASGCVGRQEDAHRCICEVLELGRGKWFARNAR